MSRHIVPLGPDRELVVGWDPPLQTFFAQLYDATIDEDENPVVWLGLMDRVLTVDDLLLQLEADVPSDVRDQLAADKRGNIA